MAVIFCNNSIHGVYFHVHCLLCYAVLLMFTDARDWRAHLDQMQKYRSGIDEALATTKGQLDKLHSDISHMLDKIDSREKYLNSQLEPLLVQYRALQVGSESMGQFVALLIVLFTLQVSSDSMVQYVALRGALFTLQFSSESWVQYVALLVALQVTGTVGFIVFHSRVHCLYCRSEVTVGSLCCIYELTVLH